MIDLKIFHPYKVVGLKRVGSKNDGGYVIHFPSLQYVECLISYGVGYDVRFEKEFNAITNVPIYAFDPTMKKLDFLVEKIRNGRYYATVKQLTMLSKWMVMEKNLSRHQIKFIQEGLSNKNTKLFKTFDYHLERYDLRKKKIFLKVDIEGAEYDVL